MTTAGTREGNSLFSTGICGEYSKAPAQIPSAALSDPLSCIYHGQELVGCITKTREATPARWSNCIEYLPFSYDPLLQNVCVLTLLLSKWWTQTQPKSAGAPKGFACHFVEGCVRIKTTYLKQLLFLFCSSASEWWTGTNVTENPFPSFNL